MSKADEALSLATAAGFEIIREFDASNDGGKYYIEGSYKVIEMRRLHGARPVHGYDLLTIRTHGPKLLNAVLLFGDRRPFGSKTCTSIPALTRALLDVRNDRRGRKALAAHLDIPFT